MKKAVHISGQAIIQRHPDDTRSFLLHDLWAQSPKTLSLHLNRGYPPWQSNSPAEPHSDVVCSPLIVRTPLPEFGPDFLRTAQLVSLYTWANLLHSTELLVHSKGTTMGPKWSGLLNARVHWTRALECRQKRTLDQLG